jgi:antitoxin HigA-1
MKTLAPIGPAANKPGEILRTEFLEPLGLSQNEPAAKSGLDRMRISEIVRGRRAITPLTAIALGKVFGTGARFWMNLQTDYDLAVEAKAESNPLRVTLRVAKRAVTGRHPHVGVYAKRGRAVAAKRARKRPRRRYGKK